jgi:hypothetical protein
MDAVTRFIRLRAVLVEVFEMFLSPLSGGYYATIISCQVILPLIYHCTIFQLLTMSQSNPSKMTAKSRMRNGKLVSYA